MSPESRVPETLLDELIQTGREWITARARERAVAPPTEPGKGTVPAAREDLAGQEESMRATATLRERFSELAREFVESVDEV